MKTTRNKTIGLCVAAVCKWMIVYFVLAVFVAQVALGADFDPKAGNFWTFDMDGYPFTVQIYNYKNKVNGYSVLLIKSPQDPYGGGSYIGQVPGVGLCDIGVDIHDAFTEDYEGIAIYYPPRPINGTIQHGDPVGTMRQWIGYNVIDDDDVDMFEKDTWEVLGYEDVTVPYGTFVNAMKLLHKNYYAMAIDVNGSPEPDGDWEFDSSCSEYLWWVPCVGMIKSAEYEDESETIELTHCKVSCEVVTDPTPTDVSLALSGSKLPASVLFGNTLKLSLIALIENIDIKACHASKTVDIAFYLQNIDTDEKMYIGQLNRPISKLAPGKTKKFMARFILSDPVEIGDYRFVAEMGEMTAILDDHVLRVAEPFVLLETELIRSNLPPALIAGTSVKTDIQAAIFNRGNVPVPAGETVTIEIVARSAIDPNDIVVLSVADVPVGNLKPSMSKKVKLPIIFAADMPEGDYFVEVCLEGEKVFMLNDHRSIVIDKPFTQLELELNRSNLPSGIIVGTSVRGDILVNVTNWGNVATSKTQVETITVVANQVHSANEIVLATFDCRLNNIAPSKTKTVKLPISFSADIPEGEYILNIRLKESELSILPPIAVAEPFISLQIESVISNVPDFVVAGTNVTANIPLDIFNRGNILTPQTEVAVLEAIARPICGGEDILLGAMNCPAGGLLPSRSKRFTFPVPFPASLPEGVYQIVLCLNGQEQFLVEQPVSVEEPTIDLAGSLVGSVSPKIIVLGGSGNAVFSLQIVNNGTTPTSKTQTIGVAVYGRRLPATDYNLMGEILEQNVANLSHGQTLQKTFTIPIDNSGSLQSGTYELLAHIDSQDDIKEENENDNWIVLGQASVQVVSGLMDITMFNSGRSMAYNSTVKGSYFWESGSGITSSYYESNGAVSDYFDFLDSDSREHYEWSSGNDGTRLEYYRWKSGGWENCSFDFNALVLPKNFQLKQQYKDTSPATGYHRLYGADFYFSGTAQTTAEVTGFESLTVGGVRYDALKIIFSLAVNADGTLDLRPYGGKYFETKAILKKDTTYWAVPGIGVVKSSSKNYYKLSLIGSGGGSETWSGTETRELIP